MIDKVTCKAIESIVFVHVTAAEICETVYNILWQDKGLGTAISCVVKLCKGIQKNYLQIGKVLIQP